MAQLLVFFLIVGAAVVALKIAIIMIFLVGLIWRPKETIGLIVVLGAFALLRNYPGPIIGGLVVLALIALVRSLRGKRNGSPPPLLTDDSDS